MSWSRADKLSQSGGNDFELWTKQLPHIMSVINCVTPPHRPPHRYRNQCVETPFWESSPSFFRSKWNSKYIKKKERWIKWNWIKWNMHYTKQLPHIMSVINCLTPYPTPYRNQCVITSVFNTPFREMFPSFFRSKWNSKYIKKKERWIKWNWNKWNMHSSPGD